MATYTRRERIIVLVLALGAFTGTLNGVLLIPFLGLVAREFRLSEAAVGQLSTTYAVIGAVVGLLAAPLMDRFQRKRLVQFGLLVVGLGAALSATAPSFPVLLFSRALAGFSAAFVNSCCYAATSDVFPDPDRRNRCIGTLFSAAGIVAVVGVPILAQLALAFGWRWAVATLLVPVALLTVGASLLPRRELKPRQAGVVGDYLARYREVLRHAAVSWLLAANLLRNVAWMVPLTYSVAIWIGLFHLSLRDYGWVFSGAGVVFFVGSNVAPALLRRIVPYRAFLLGLVLQFAAGLGFVLTRGNLGGALFAWDGVFCFGGPLSGVAMNVLLQDVLPESRGAVLSLSTTTNQSGSALAGILGGLILAWLGAGALLPLTSLLIPAAMLACRLSVRRPATVAEPVEYGLV